VEISHACVVKLWKFPMLNRKAAKIMPEVVECFYINLLINKKDIIQDINFLCALPFSEW
jgi:hypothetical protein